MGSSQLAFPVHSWFSSEHKWRVFFGPKAYLPSETPDTLVPFRWGTVRQLQARLPNLQGRCSVLLMWRPCTALPCVTARFNRALSAWLLLQTWSAATGNVCLLANSQTAYLHTCLSPVRMCLPLAGSRTWQSCAVRT